MQNSNVTPRPRKKSRSLAENVVEVMKTRILDGDLKPGDKLPTESAIMQEQGVSRTVVREAISRLQAAGHVETRHGIGTFVLERPAEGPLFIDPATITTLRDVLAMLELRISLEVEAAGLAAQRRSDEQLQEMRRLLDQMKARTEQPAEAVSFDLQFHLQIALSTGNRYFNDIMTYLSSVLIPRTRLNSAYLAHDDQERYQLRLDGEHEDIYNAIARQDTDAARAAMRLHLTNSRERLRRANEEVGAGQPSR
ncbi:GntR family transcriptional regulator [Pseudomonas asuensis]|uniref:GntR family transcriptional regulator n=1 Tax=Pseudomonas asuensis TaxID=1825787 RepID=A0ABQ2GH85_9PSED|nr:FadR/GntR family transcriptional regulator [Pseudomonas asuensis]GGL96068.1 GntR family transcriptional regulator [Pseudomonas asuensis]